MDDTCYWDASIDITGDMCPMTFVRTRLALDRMAPGGVLLVRLRGAEPERNVPASAAAQGHQVLSTRRDADGSVSVWIRRGG